MSTLDEALGGLLVDPSDGYGKLGSHHEAFAISTKVSPSDATSIAVAGIRLTWSAFSKQAA
jgi:hypothetical protein